MSQSYRHDIFLSYSRKDSEMMRQVRASLQSAGFSAWTDEGIPPGSDWQTEIEKAITDAKCIVVLLSKTAKESKWVRLEISHSLDLDKKIFPVVVKDETRDVIPFVLKNSQYVDIHRDYDKPIANLLEEIAHYLNVEMLQQQQWRREARELAAQQEEERRAAREAQQQVALRDQRLERIEAKRKDEFREYQRQQKLEAERQRVHRIEVEMAFSPYNPINWFRLLYWFLLAPAHLANYKLSEIEGDYPLYITKTANWLIAFLLFFPLLLSLLAVAFKLAPMTEFAHQLGFTPVGLWPVIAGYVLLWFTTGFFGNLDFDNDFVYFAVLGAFAILGAVVVLGAVAVSGMVVVLGGVVILGMVSDVSDASVFPLPSGCAIQGASEFMFACTCVATWAGADGDIFIIYIIYLILFLISLFLREKFPHTYGRLTFVILILSYTFLIWYYLLGNYS